MGIKFQGPDCLQWDQSVVFLICEFKRSHLYSRTENGLHELNSCHLTCSIAKIRANTVTISRQAATAIAVIVVKVRFHYLYLCHNGNRIDPRAMHRSGNRAHTDYLSDPNDEKICSEPLQFYQFFSISLMFCDFPLKIINFSFDVVDNYRCLR
ncbi:hypothetical protein GQX74_008286 [Glossina fuscipes]|nr:hypothetical protein GQX74_008286 [Glossina fuscipes]